MTVGIFKTANRRLWRNKARSFLTIMAIFVGSMTVMLIFAINNGVSRFIDEQTRNLGGEEYIMITPGSNASALTSVLTGTNNLTEYSSRDNFFTAAQVQEIKNLPGIDAKNFYAPKTLQNTSAYLTSNQTKKKFNFTYTTLLSEDYDIAMGYGELPRPDTDAYEIVLQSGMAEVLGFASDEAALGEPLKIVYQNPYSRRYRTFVARIVGITSANIATINQPIISTALEMAIYNFYTEYAPDSQKGQIYYIKTRVDLSKTTMQELQQTLAEKGFYSTTVNDMMGEMRGFFEIVVKLLMVLGWITLITSAIGVVNTLLISVEERTREIGLNKALGMSSLKIFANFSAEAISLGFWGVTFGIIVAMIAGNFINDFAHQAGGFLEMFPTFELCQFAFNDIVVVGLIVMAIAFLAGTIPAARAARKNPIDALRYE